MITIFIILHIAVCIALIMIVLLQTGKGADMGAAFGGGGSQTLFGSTGASTFLSKATTVVAVIFMLTSLWLAYSSTHKAGESIMMDSKPPVEQQATTAVPEKEADAVPIPSQPEKPAEAEPSAQK
jgi:preprotein translocase subunit SecG